MILNISFFVLIFFVLIFFIIRNNKTKADFKTLSKADKAGIKSSIFIFLIMVIDIIDIAFSNSLVSNFKSIFTMITIIELISWILVIPGLFIFVLIKLIISIKNEKRGCVVAVISLIYNLIIWMLTAGQYASRF